jgi:hypothetical protein
MRDELAAMGARLAALDAGAATEPDELERLAREVEAAALVVATRAQLFQAALLRARRGGPIRYWEGGGQTPMGSAT